MVGTIMKCVMINISFQHVVYVREKLKESKKLYSLIVAHQNGVDSLIIYQMRDKDKPKTEEEKYTVQRMYATLNSGDVMLIQNYVFNKLLITIDELKGE